MDTVRYSRFRAWAARIVLAVLSAPALAASRVALVVGNASYAHAPALANPLNDVQALASAAASGSSGPSRPSSRAISAARCRSMPAR